MKWTTWFNSASFTSIMFLTIAGVCLLIGAITENQILILSGIIIGLIGLLIWVLLWLYIKVNNISLMGNYNPWL